MTVVHTVLMENCKYRLLRQSEEASHQDVAPNYDGSGRQRCDPEPHDDEVSNGFNRLPPIPASGDSDSRFRRKLGEFLEQVPENRFSFFAGGKQIDDPSGNVLRI